MIDPLILVRSVHIAATVLASGTVCFLVLVADVPELRRSLSWLVWSAIAVAILSGIGWLVLVAVEIFSAPIIDVCLHGGAWQVATDTRFGMVWCTRAALAVLLGVSMLWQAARWLQLITAALLIALLALIGHAGATPGLAGHIHLASDMVHLLGTGAWLGGLPALALLLAKARGQSVIEATRRFSRLGIACVAALLASGAINSWNLLGAPGDLLATDYGRLLLFKICMFVAMIGIAAVNRYHLTPQLPSPDALGALQRNSLCEIGLGLCVLMFVGTLGTMVPAAHVHVLSTEIPDDAAFVHIHTAEAMADVTLNPGRAGTIKATIRVSRENFTDFAAKQVRLRLEQPGAGAKPVDRAAVRMVDGTWTIDRLEIGQPGIWTVLVVVTSAAGNSLVLDAPVVIGR